MSDHERNERLHLALDALIGDETTRPDDLTILSNYMNYRPEESLTANILPVAEMEERLAIIKSLRLPVTAIRASVFMAIPIDQLRKSVEADMVNLIHAESIRQFVRLFFRWSRGKDKPDDKASDAPEVSPKKRKAKALVDDENPTSESDDEGSEYSPSQEMVSEKERISRDTAERNMCLDRDGRKCILVKTADPDACHIVPFTINSTSASLEEMNRYVDYIALLSEPALGLITERIGCSDQSWNMIALNTQMHRWSGKPYFGLRCLGIVPINTEKAEVKLQFLWTRLSENQKQGAGKGKDKGKGKDNRLHWNRVVDERQIREMVEDWKTEIYKTRVAQNDEGYISACHAGSNRNIYSGQTFSIFTGPEDAEKMKAMIDIQWACVQIATMSGAADWDDFFDDDYQYVADKKKADDFFSELQVERMRSWDQQYKTSDPHTLPD